MTAEIEPTELPSTDPRLIQELFDKDPLKLEEREIDLIIAEFRSGRMAYLNPPEPEAKKTTKGKTSVIDLGQLDLSDLGL